MTEQEPERVTVPPVPEQDEPMRPEQPGEHVPEEQHVVHGEPVVITPAAEAAPVQDAPGEVPADEPTTVTMRDQMAVSTDASVLPGTVHPSILVRLADVLAHAENFLMRHPALEAEAGADLRSGLGTLERINDPAAVQAARDAVEPQPAMSAPPEAEAGEVRA